MTNDNITTLQPQTPSNAGGAGNETNVNVAGTKEKCPDFLTPDAYEKRYDKTFNCGYTELLPAYEAEVMLCLPKGMLATLLKLEIGPRCFSTRADGEFFEPYDLVEWWNQPVVQAAAPFLRGNSHEGFGFLREG